MVLVAEPRLGWLGTWGGVSCERSGGVGGLARGDLIKIVRIESAGSSFFFRHSQLGRHDMGTCVLPKDALE